VAPPPARGGVFFWGVGGGEGSGGYRKRRWQDAQIVFEPKFRSAGPRTVRRACRESRGNITLRAAAALGRRLRLGRTKFLNAFLHSSSSALLIPWIMAANRNARAEANAVEGETRLPPRHAVMIRCGSVGQLRSTASFAAIRCNVPASRRPGPASVSETKCFLGQIKIGPAA